MHSSEAKFGDIIITFGTGNIYFITDKHKSSGKWGILMKAEDSYRERFRHENGLYGVSCEIKNKRKATNSDLLLAVSKCKNEEIREKLKKLLKERL